MNPWRLEGQKTAAFELLEDLPTIDGLCIPVGNAGNVTAYWKGFQERGHDLYLYGFQAAGAAPLVEGHVFENPETVASAIRIGNPARWEEAVARLPRLARAGAGRHRRRDPGRLPVPRC